MLGAPYWKIWSVVVGMSFEVRRGTRTSNQKERKGKERKKEKKEK